ncbi:MAG: glutamine amidotransferase [Alphaproteobacteria bacterium]|nr:glutamine amidotransferase [Alphaproteobacteria bacterium]
MKTAVALRHVAFEDLGSLTRILASRGYDIRYCDAGIDDLEAARSADLLIVLGGPISVNDEALYPFLADECALVGERARRERPTLGLCLGAQFIAKALGARVYAGPVKEIGWSTLILTPAGRRSCLRALDGAPVLHWHGETFDLPSGAELLAGTTHYANQAFAVGETTLALQFHCEIQARGLERWYLGHTLELASAGIDVPSLRRDGLTHGERIEGLAATVFGGWLAQIEAAT